MPLVVDLDAEPRDCRYCSLPLNYQHRFEDRVLERQGLHSSCFIVVTNSVRVLALRTETLSKYIPVGWMLEGPL
jgi:hypothetical protein